MQSVFQNYLFGSRERCASSLGEAVLKKDVDMIIDY